jgi:hypothetical protein
MARFSSAGEAKGVHNLTLYRVANGMDGRIIRATLVATASVNLSTTAGDVNGYAWAPVATVMVLEPGQKYIVASTETKGGDYWADSITKVQARPGALSGYATPVYNSGAGWSEIIIDHDSGYINGACFGPLNIETAAA